LNVNLGCGGMNIPGYIRVDINEKVKPDVLYDLNVYPYPFENNQFDKILASHIIEHLDNPEKFIKEIHRIAKSGCEITIITPHYSNFTSYSDITHKWHFSSFSLNRERIGLDYKEKTTIKLRGFWQIFGLQILINKFNKARIFWERYLSFVIRATDIKFVLTVNK